MRRACAEAISAYSIIQFFHHSILWLEAPDHLQELIELLIGEGALEGGHAAIAVLDDVLDFVVGHVLNLFGAQVFDLQHLAHVGAGAVFAVAHDTVLLEEIFAFCWWVLGERGGRKGCDNSDEGKGTAKKGHDGNSVEERNLACWSIHPLGHVMDEWNDTRFQLRFASGTLRRANM